MQQSMPTIPQTGMTHVGRCCKSRANRRNLRAAGGRRGPTQRQTPATGRQRSGRREQIHKRPLPQTFKQNRLFSKPPQNIRYTSPAAWLRLSLDARLSYSYNMYPPTYYKLPSFPPGFLCQLLSDRTYESRAEDLYHTRGLQYFSFYLYEISF